MSFSIKRLALKCAHTLQVFGVKASLEEQKSLMGIALLNNDLKVIKKLLEDGNKETTGNFLLQAANVGSPEAVKIILDKLEAVSISVNLSRVINSLGNTALHEAAISSSKYSEDIMELLILKEFRLLEIENDDWRTPLHMAAYGNYKHVDYY